jgi:signal transduction histidine kinase
MRRFSGTSLQFRLTLELMLLCVGGLGAVALWAGWQMEQNLIVAHKKALEHIASRFPEQVELYSETGSIETALERSISKVTTPGLFIAVKSPTGKPLAQSANRVGQVEKGSMTLSMDTPTQPKIFSFGDRFVVLCGGPLTIRQQLIGHVYFSQDITREQQQLQQSLWRLFGISSLTIAILALIISQRLRHAMQPIKQMSQLARSVSADDLIENLNPVQLQLNRAPDEVLGLAQAFNEMLIRLSGAWEQQRQFVGNVSHELRTPLTVIIGYLQSLLRRSHNLSSHQQQALETATAETERTIRMLQDLLDLARADSGHLHLRRQPIVLNTLVMEVAAMSQQVTTRAVTVLVTHEDLLIYADQDRLQQILINLIDNAIKYSAPEYPVNLVLEKDHQSALIHVQDRGIGIALSHQNRIFERFYRVDEGMTRSRDGTGLGLAIAKGFAEAMQGRILLRSKPNEGSTFTLQLPLSHPFHKPDDNE